MQKCVDWWFMQNDYRVKITKSLIRQSLLSMLKNSSAEKITVKELCQNAHINRATFYSHYENIKELLNEIKNEFSSELMKSISSFTNEDCLETFFINICNFAKNNLDYCEIIFSENSGELYSYIIELARPKFIKLWKEDGCTDEESLEFLYTFVANGGLAVIKSWIKSGAKQSPEYIAKFIMSNVSDNICKYK